MPTVNQVQKKWKTWHSSTSTNIQKTDEDWCYV